MAKSSEVLNGDVKVKRLLRRQSTQLFFMEDAGWTDNPAEAKCFLDVVEIAETCARCRLDDVEVILRLDSQASDFFCTTVR